MIVTVQPGPGFRRELLGALARFGRFRATPFRDVCVGRVDDRTAFLDALRDARAAGAPWTQRVGRVIPADAVFWFTPQTFTDRLKETVTPLAERIGSGSFCVRIERRGFAGEVKTQDIERAIGEHVHALAAAQGKTLRTQFDDPDFVIAVETLGNECGVALLPRALREAYPFVRAR
ncbi:MAG: THUMP domain-containing protein [Burkholderiaceae bacterium]